MLDRFSMSSALTTTSIAERMTMNNISSETKMMCLNIFFVFVFVSILQLVCLRIKENKNTDVNC